MLAPIVGSTASLPFPPLGEGALHLLVLQHSHDAPPGLIAEEVLAVGGRLDLREAERGVSLPAGADGHDGLILLGGVMNALDDERCPHFPALLALVREFAAHNRPVLGVCLGAQLLARAFGGAIRLGGAPEFGFVPLHALPAAGRDPLLAGLPFPTAIMQWHDDTFDLPPGAVHLLRSAACPNQAFRIGASVYGLQCHFEVTAAILEQWLDLYERLGHDPAPLRRTRGALPRLLPVAQRFGRWITRRWLRLVADRSGCVRPRLSNL